MPQTQKQPEADTPELIDEEKLCEEVLGGMSRRQARRLRNANVIPFIQVGRKVLFDRAAVVAALKTRETAAVPATA